MSSARTLWTAPQGQVCVYLWFSYWKLWCETQGETCDDAVRVVFESCEDGRSKVTPHVSHRSREVNSWALSFHKLCLKPHCIHQQITAAQFATSREQNWQHSEALSPESWLTIRWTLFMYLRHYTFKGLLIILYDILLLMTVISLSIYIYYYDIFMT